MDGQAASAWGLALHIRIPGPSGPLQQPGSGHWRDKGSPHPQLRRTPGCGGWDRGLSADLASALLHTSSLALAPRLTVL